MPIIKYYTSQVFKEEYEISFSEAQHRESYVACYLNDQDQSERAEIFENKIIYHVVYYSQAWPNDAIVNQHINSFPQVSFELKSSLKKEGNEYIRQIYFHNKEGKLKSITDEYLDDSGNLLRQVRMDIYRNVSGIIEYEYDNFGELEYTRERLPNGKVISTYDCKELEYV
jgi:hypothetical protein